MFKIASKIIYNSYLAYLWTRTRFHKRSDRDRDQIRSCDPDRPIAFHKSDHDRLIRSRNTKPNSLLPIQSWHKSFTGKYRTEMTWSWLNKNHQTGDIYSWYHNGRCGDVIYECRYERVMASSVHAHWVWSQYNTVWTCHIWQVCVCD